jgi:hypothetical protein
MDDWLMDGWLMDDWLMCDLVWRLKLLGAWRFFSMRRII